MNNATTTGIFVFYVVTLETVRNSILCN